MERWALQNDIGLVKNIWEFVMCLFFKKNYFIYLAVRENSEQHPHVLPGLRLPPCHLPALPGQVVDRGGVAGQPAGIRVSALLFPTKNNFLLK